MGDECVPRWMMNVLLFANKDDVLRWMMNVEDDVLPWVMNVFGKGGRGGVGGRG